MADERDEVVAELERTGRQFVALAARASAAWNVPPPGGGWSLAETAEHVTLVEASVGKLMARKFFAEPAPPELLQATIGKDEKLRRFHADRTRKRVAPDFVTPRGKFSSREELVATFANCRATIVAGFRDAPEDLRRYGAEHPILGPLDGVQWGLFLAGHLDRHLAQMEEILGLQP
jgi:hypothetical protein